MQANGRTSDKLNAFRAEIETRCNRQCELCSSTSELAVSMVAHADEPDVNSCLLACEPCRTQFQGSSSLDAAHWSCLHQSAWSHIPAVQVVSWRLLSQLKSHPWAQELFEQIYLDEETLAWAEKGLLPSTDDVDEPTLDSNGTRLDEGDTVQIIKDLDVKGTGFVAKRGTIVKGIRLTTNPEHVEGRVNKTTIVLKTCFLKKTSS